MYGLHHHVTRDHHRQRLFCVIFELAATHATIMSAASNTVP